MEVVIRLYFLKNRNTLNNNLYITNFCYIKNNTIIVDGKEIATKESELSCAEFLKQVYKEHVNDYAKFFKMDTASKLSFITAEFLYTKVNLSATAKENMAIVLSNKSASLDTDRKHQETINNKDAYYPSPAIFVYTLPNIGIGEISIRHQILGENAFFVFDSFNAKTLSQYAESLLHAKKSTHILCGWVNVDQDEYEAFMYLVSQEGTYKHTEENINTLYQENKWKH